MRSWGTIGQPLAADWLFAQHDLAWPALVYGGGRHITYSRIHSNAFHHAAWRVAFDAVQGLTADIVERYHWPIGE